MARTFCFHVIPIATVLFLFACSDSPENDPVTDATNAGFSQADMRIESEDKLTIPVEEAEEVWRYLNQNFVADAEKLRSIDVSLQSQQGEERIVNVYYDTPELQLYAIQSTVRHRKRTKISEAGDEKIGKEKMVVKSGRLVSVVLPDGDVKFGVAYHHKLKSLEDKHPAIGLVKRPKRDKFKKILENLGVDANDLRPVLTCKQRRRRIEIAYHSSPFLSISLDEVSSEKLWAKTNFAELVLELDEATYTTADENIRQYMQDLAAKISQTVREHFPALRRDLTPKYNKAFDALAEKIPLFVFLMKHGLI